jgi:hypothetical protein
MLSAARPWADRAIGFGSQRTIQLLFDLGPPAPEGSDGLPMVASPRWEKSGLDAEGSPLMMASSAGG